ncbi:MAG: hypothetical protein JWL77_4288 [Chthonomonadaceae bacterium]|nr:hypothetical protein [Chthonomonadaceae bacterium]
MKREVLADQIVRIGMECAKQCGLPESYVEDCALEFLYRKFKPEALFGMAWTGDEEKRLVAMAEANARKYLERLRNRARKEVSMTGPDGTESGGPAGQIVSREPGPEEVQLRRQIWDFIEGALPNLTASQVDLFQWCFEQEERTIDLKEASGRSAEALWKARTRLRVRLQKLLIAAGMDEDMACALLNELERLRQWR